MTQIWLKYWDQSTQVNTSLIQDLIEIKFQIVFGLKTFIFSIEFFLYFYVFSFFSPFYIKNFFILPSPIFYRAFTRLDCYMVLWNRANDYRLELWFTWFFYKFLYNNKFVWLASTYYRWKYVHLSRFAKIIHKQHFIFLKW